MEYSLEDGMLVAVVLVIFNYVIPIMTGVLASQYNDGLWGCGPFPNAITLLKNFSSWMSLFSSY
jgi:hypothetical protein